MPRIHLSPAPLFHHADYYRSAPDQGRLTALSSMSFVCSAPPALRAYVRGSTSPIQGAFQSQQTARSKLFSAGAAEPGSFRCEPRAVDLARLPYLKAPGRKPRPRPSIRRRPANSITVPRERNRTRRRTPPLHVVEARPVVLRELLPAPERRTQHPTSKDLVSFIQILLRARQLP